MSGEERRLSATATELRRSFDQAFAEAPRVADATAEDILAIRLGGNPYALRLSDIAGLHCDRKVVPVPSPVPALLGVASLRGVIAPIYDLGALLGYAPVTGPRWFALARGDKAIGLAFAIFEAHLRLPRASFSDGAVQAAGVVRRIIHMASVLEAIAVKER